MREAKLLPHGQSQVSLLQISTVCPLGAILLASVPSPAFTLYSAWLLVYAYCDFAAMTCFDCFATNLLKDCFALRAPGVEQIDQLRALIFAWFL
jgi:hypothetical protein